MIIMLELVNVDKLDNKDTHIYLSLLSSYSYIYVHTYSYVASYSSSDHEAADQLACDMLPLHYHSLIIAAQSKAAHVQ